MNQWFRWLGVLALTGTLGAVEIPPFYPAPAPRVPAGTAISADAVTYGLPDGVTVKPAEFNRSRLLNGKWKISGLERSTQPFTENPKGFENPAFDDSRWDTIAVPLNWYKKYTKIYNKKESFVQGFYRHDFDLSADELHDQRISMHFKFIGYEAILWVNGKRVGRHHGDFVPWTVDITDFVKPGKNQFTMQVISDFGPAHGAVKKARHIYGSQWGASNIKGGVWGDVELRFEPLIRFEKLFIVPQLAENGVKIRAWIDNTTSTEVKARCVFAVTSAMKTAANQFAGSSPAQFVTLKPGRNTVEGFVPMAKAQLWSPEQPYLYFGSASLELDKKVIAARSERFGYRDFKIKNGKFHLNNQRIYLWGENLPAVFFGGNGNDARDFKDLYERLAGFKSLGYNIIRNAHNPISEEALAIADEIGIMFYDEWGWSFTKVIDEPEFQKNNLEEFRKWLTRDFNHPSVVMWSCGNEVRHAKSPDIRRQLDLQVKTVREFDLQGRPAGSFSGSACWRGYGTERLVTDFIDHHTYLGNGELPWTHWFQNFNDYYAGSLEHYEQKGTRLDMPYIIWECVGFSWGGKKDKDFKLNDIQAYQSYVRRKNTWASPQGVGYIGCLGLAAAVDPARGMDYGKELYGHRLLELKRQDTRIDGFAPWFHGSALPAATLWNQPLFVGIRNDRMLPPRNFFAENPGELELFVANSTAEMFDGGEAWLSFQLDAGRNVPGQEVKIGKVAPFEVGSVKFSLAIPVNVRGNVQLRVVLKAAGREVSRNFYPLYVGTRPAPLKEAPTVALLDVGNADDLKSTGEVLRQLGVKFKVIDSRSIPASYRVAVIPAAIENRSALRLNKDAIFEWVEKEGGTLVVLAQNANSGSLLGGTTLVTAGNTLTDLVIPEHPVFKGLTHANFDTWENPEFGYSITTTLSPFLANALAARGAMNGAVGVDTAVMEATFGKGRIFWTQLDGVKLFKRDSVAAAYLRNVFDYLLLAKPYAKIQPLDPARSRASVLDPARLETVDLRAFANRSFSDDKDNDGKGGWTDQGTNDFRNMPLGRQTAAGVLFDIIDPAKNGGKSCIVLQGSERPDFPEHVTGIKVGRKFTRIFFLHTAAWSQKEVGAYRIHYADGSETDYLISHGINIGDWWNTSYLSKAAPGIMRANLTKPQVGTYVACWENLHPEKEIASIDFLSISSPLIKSIDFLPGKRAVPVLVAVTGEKSNPAAFFIQERFGGSGENPSCKASVTEVKTTLPDGSQAMAYRFALPAPDKGAPYVIARYPEANKGKKLADYHSLTFWYKVEKPGAIDVAIPETDWKAAMRKSLELNGTDWQRARIDLDEIGRGKFLEAKQELRGEIFFFNGKNKQFANPRGPVSFLVTGVSLE